MEQSVSIAGAGKLNARCPTFFFTPDFRPLVVSGWFKARFHYNVARALKYTHRLLIGVGLGVSGILDPAQMKAIFHDFIALICRLLSRLVSWKLKINPRRVAATLGCTSHVCLAGSWSFRRHK